MLRGPARARTDEGHSVIDERAHHSVIRHDLPIDRLVFAATFGSSLDNTSCTRLFAGEDHARCVHRKKRPSIEPFPSREDRNAVEQPSPQMTRKSQTMIGMSWRNGSSRTLRQQTAIGTQLRGPAGARVRRDALAIDLDLHAQVPAGSRCINRSIGRGRLGAIDVGRDRSIDLTLHTHELHTRFFAGEDHELVALTKDDHR